MSKPTAYWDASALAATLRQQQAEAAKLDAAIAENPAILGYSLKEETPP